jgi:hypothetical protein
MRKYAFLPLFVLVIASCKSTNSEENPEPAGAVKQEETLDKSLPSADYSSLFIDYECNMSAEEFSSATGIPLSAVVKKDSPFKNKCFFEISGFGDKPIVITIGTGPSTKANNKKEIEGFLEREKKNENIMGMGIELSETGDNYIASTPHVGRVVILNENYDFVYGFEFSQRGIHKGRTVEQHEDLRQKMVMLANHLLKKNKN